MKRMVSLTALFVSLGVVLSAHVMVSPPSSKPGITQNYELRVHNESTVATTQVELEVPQGVTVLQVEQLPAGTIETKTTGDHITSIVWRVDVLPTKYVALKFSATNPERDEIRWNVRQQLADGSFVDWSDKPGAKQKASVTSLRAEAVSPAATPAHADEPAHDHNHPGH
jgi:uncharacterized protein YcnI